jgi:hypothetical protein
MTSLRSFLLGAAIFFSAMACSARPPALGHPIIGTWHLSVPGTVCQETWEFRADGTTHNVSGSEESTSEYEISDAPNAQGYYVLSDTIKEINGQPDCKGAKIPVGDRALVYLMPTTSGGFFLCMKPHHDSCTAAMVRVAHSDS